MKSQNRYLINANEYDNIDSKKISSILLKDGTVLQLNNKISPNKYINRQLNRNISDSNLPVNNANNLAKMRKFNSFSANINYKSRFNTQNQNNGFYVIPIINGNSKFIAMKVPDNDQYIDLTKIPRPVENLTFQVIPKKYNYKPYKPPKRKHNLVITNTKQNYNYYCSKSNFVKNKK